MARNPQSPDLNCSKGWGVTKPKLGQGWNSRLLWFQHGNDMCLRKSQGGSEVSDRLPSSSSRLSWDQPCLRLFFFPPAVFLLLL